MAENELMKAVSKRIRAVLKEKQWTNNQLGREAGLSKSFISMILNNRCNVTLGTIAKIEDALGVPIMEILK